ncbi:hypothetical protein FSS13T_17770 [Flavobacterium saliperosum S13]|uniref:Uncharacterized protein n=2 Tax=Flavobacterium saliperosum TaxID=329186 RepID=A0A1G4VJL9_9FLAO|nr:hypothetical protein FSS13T_17770 [Flavobacterium saliperosum S13]SCX07738.1 hypothetical protein SAMN02927925_01218 [Flavobacterium saliperosum]
MLDVFLILNYFTKLHRENPEIRKVLKICENQFNPCYLRSIK